MLRRIYFLTPNTMYTSIMLSVVERQLRDGRWVLETTSLQTPPLALKAWLRSKSAHGLGRTTRIYGGVAISEPSAAVRVRARAFSVRVPDLSGVRGGLIRRIGRGLVYALVHVLRPLFASSAASSISSRRVQIRRRHGI